MQEVFDVGRTNKSFKISPWVEYIESTTRIREKRKSGVEEIAQEIEIC